MPDGTLSGIKRNGRRLSRIPAAIPNRLVPYHSTVAKWCAHIGSATPRALLSESGAIGARACAERYHDYTRRMTLVWGWDAIHANLGGVPAGQGAGYTTGTRDIRWTNADWAAHPGAVRICQDSAASDDTADELDVETYAATPPEVPGWFSRALAARQAGTRAGQRFPAVYCSLSVVPDVAAELGALGELGKPKLHVADWSLTMDQAAAMVGTVYYGMVVIGVQFANRGQFDSDVWDSAWLAGSSPEPTPPPVTTPATTPEVLVQSLPELAAGSAVPAVRTLQALLVARGYGLGTTGEYRDGIDGTFGPLTESAVKAFQASAGITVDGIVGPVTWPRLPLV